MFLFDALERLPKDSSYQCKIIGGGKEKEVLEKYVSQSEVLKEHITFIGRIPHEEMDKEYRQGDVLIMPSIRETTGSVVLEAISRGIPVITINAFGGGRIISEDIGWLYSGSGKDEYINNLCAIINECIDNREKVKAKGERARQEARKYSWECLLQYYNSIYSKLLSK